MRLKCDLEDQNEWITTSHSYVTNRDSFTIENRQFDAVSKYSTPEMQ